MELSDRHRRFLLLEQGAIPTVFNLLLNGLIAWGLFRSSPAVPLWGESSLGVDLLATAFLLPFLTCLIVSSLVARHVRSGKVPPLPLGQPPHSHWFQRSPSTRGLLLGVAGVLFGAAPNCVGAQPPTSEAISRRPRPMRSYPSCPRRGR